MARRPQPPLPPLECPGCHTTFIPNKWWQKYCSPDCNQEAYLIRKRKKKQGLSPLDTLDPTPPSGPSEAQIADRQRRIEGGPPDPPPPPLDHNFYEREAVFEKQLEAAKLFAQKWGSPGNNNPATETLSPGTKVYSNNKPDEDKQS